MMILTNKFLQYLFKQMIQSLVVEDWLIDTTERWCKERAIYLALVEVSLLQMDMISRKVLMLIPVFYQMH